MTGTPLDLTPFGPLLGAIGLVYWGFAALGLWLALRGPAARKTKLVRAGIVVLLFGLLPGRSIWQELQARGRLNDSMALFKKRCETVGEKITRTVENVDGIVWMRWRPKEINFSDQFKLDDPYGRDCGEEECIGRLLRVSEGAFLYPDEAKRHQGRYAYVESINPQDGKAYRYRGVLRPNETGERMKLNGEKVPDFLNRFTVLREPIEKVRARYGVVWDDVSTREDREHWIAGGSLKIVDLQTDEVIAQFIGFLIDPGQGNTGGFRSPWTWAQTYAPRCPPQTYVHANEFAIKVLQPAKGD